MAKFDPFLSLDCARVEGRGRKERKGSHFAIWQHWLKDEWTLESTVNVKNSTPGTYFMSVGWAPAGYGGIQEISENERTVIFSMWNGGCGMGVAGEKKSLSNRIVNYEGLSACLTKLIYLNCQFNQTHYLLIDSLK